MVAYSRRYVTFWPISLASAAPSNVSESPCQVEPKRHSATWKSLVPACQVTSPGIDRALGPEPCAHPSLNAVAAVIDRPVTLGDYAIVGQGSRYTLDVVSSPPIDVLKQGIHHSDSRVNFTHRCQSHVLVVSPAWGLKGLAGNLRRTRASAPALTSGEGW